MYICIYTYVGKVSVGIICSIGHAHNAETVEDRTVGHGTLFPRFCRMIGIATKLGTAKSMSSLLQHNVATEYVHEWNPQRPPPQRRGPRLSSWKGLVADLIGSLAWRNARTITPHTHRHRRFLKSHPKETPHGTGRAQQRPLLPDPSSDVRGICRIRG